MSKKKKIKNYRKVAFEKLGVRPVVFHFRDIKPFEGVTVAIVKEKKNTVEKPIMESFLKAVRNIAITNARDRDAIERLMAGFHDETTEPPFGAASCMRYIMERHGIHGVSICDEGDQFNRKHGSDAAEGRLISSLIRQKAKRGFKGMELLKEVEEEA